MWLEITPFYVSEQKTRVHSIRLKWLGIKTNSQGPKGTKRPLWPCPASQVPPTTLSMAQDPISAEPRAISPCPSDIPSTHVTGSLLASPGLTQTYHIDLPVAHGVSGAHNCYHLALPCSTPLWASAPSSRNHLQLLVPSLRELFTPKTSWQPSQATWSWGPSSEGLDCRVPQGSPMEVPFCHWAPGGDQHAEAEDSPAGCLHVPHAHHSLESLLPMGHLILCPQVSQ